jgi:hypothetical protein
MTRSAGLDSMRRARTSNALGPLKKAYVLTQIERSALPSNSSYATLVSRACKPEISGPDHTRSGFGVRADSSKPGGSSRPRDTEATELEQWWHNGLCAVPIAQHGAE